jgi:DNA-directed RNA polymerase II subunit RPB7
LESLSSNTWIVSAFSFNMFFVLNLTHQVTLHPSYFGRNMHELVTHKLLKDVEGTCTGRYYIITIMDTVNISEGRILPGSGLAEFNVRYRAVVWRPFKGEAVGITHFAKSIIVTNMVRLTA